MKKSPIALSALCALVALPAIAAANAPRPNIIVIMCDDLGYSDVGFNGATDIRTPSLDRLARNGTICSSAYVTHPFCGPSRMGLMAGRYPHTFGAPFNLPNSDHGIKEYNKEGVPTGETLISTVLQNAGYYTGAIGKWHMGIEQPFHPNSRGFNDFYGFLGGGHYYFPEKYGPIYERQRRAGKKHIHEYALPLEHNGEAVYETEYMTDALSREAVHFVKQAAEKNQPFFLYLAYNAPHTPLEAKEEDLKEYAGIEDEKRRTYAAMVHAVDRGVGVVVDALKDTDEFDDTLIIFLSDNGGKLSTGATNRPLAKGKGSIYEGGYRVPMFFHWSGHVPAGRRFDHPVSALDFYPTFAGLGGAAIPEGKLLDGKDIWADLLAGRNPRQGEMIYVLRHRDGYSDVGARRDQWKACREIQGPWRLFDIERDMGEQHDLAAKHPELLQSIVSGAEKWSRSHTEPRWFHELKARDRWNETGMPNYAETFRPAPRRATPVKEETEKRERRKGDATRAEFIELERIKWTQNGWKWNQARVEALFDRMDANNDGIASGSERKAYWAKVYPASDPANSGSWVLKEDVSDEFDGEKLDAAKWYVEGTNGKYRRWIGRAPSQFSPKNVRVENGKLHITTKWDPDFEYSAKTKPEYKSPYEKYTTAAVQSNATFLHGYMEIKCKAADAAITSSFWTTGKRSELDVFEFVGDSKRADRDKRYPFAIHDWSTGDGEANQWKESVELDWRVADGFHVYGCEWSEDGLKFYAGGKLVKAVTRADLGKAWVLTEPLMIWVDSETFYWEGFPDEEDLPVDFEIEYIRVWQNR